MTERPLRVLYLAHAFHVGGAEEMVLTLTRRLPKRFDVRVCAIHHAGPIGDEIRRTGIGFDVLGLNPGLRRPFDILKLRAYLRRTRPHIVHTFLLTASLYGRLAALLARVPVIVGTEVNVYTRKQRSHIHAERLLMAGTDCVIASAASVRDFYINQIQADPLRVKVIYNAVDWQALETTTSAQQLREEIGIPSGAPVLSIIARLTEQKAHRVLFDALHATAALATTHVLIVGDGELRSSLEEHARRLGIDDRTHFLGARRDLGNILAASDIFVMPSLWEGLPLSLVLAMGAGVPVVATRVAGVPEVVDHRHTGLLVPPGDATALGEALSELVMHPELRVALGHAARRFVTPRFGADQYVSSITSLYDALLTSKAIA